MEWIEGCRVNDQSALLQASMRPQDVAVLLLDAFAEMTYVHGFVHGDPHPGNILVRPAPHQGLAFSSCRLLIHSQAHSSIAHSFAHSLAHPLTHSLTLPHSLSLFLSLSLSHLLYICCGCHHLPIILSRECLSQAVTCNLRMWLQTEGCCPLSGHTFSADPSNLQQRWYSHLFYTVWSLLLAYWYPSLPHCSMLLIKPPWQWRPVLCV